MVAYFARIQPRIGTLLFGASLVTLGCAGGGEDTESATETSPTSTSASATEGTDSGETDSDSGETDTETGGEDANDPGRVTLHRLNTTEYNNTVRDLLWTEQTPADDFAADDVSLGFDNIADVLTLSPLQAELYERAAESLIEEAMTVAIVDPMTWKREAEGMEVTASVGAANGEFWNLWSEGDLATTIKVEAEGDYLFRVRGYGQQAGDALPHMVLTVDGAMVAEFDVEAINTSPAIFEIEVPLTASSHTFAAGFTNDFFDPDMMLDRNLYIDWLEVSGPQGLEGDPNAQRERIFVCDPQVDGEVACGRTILAAFGRRAYRRPLTEAEIDRLMLLIDEAKGAGGSFDDGLKLALRAILVSPHFIFRVEIDPDPKSLTPHPLSDFEFATRLSYFLWSTMPDDELLALATAGELSDPKVVEEQVMRMIEDPKARALVDNFAGQWFLIRGVNNAFHDEQVFPAWSPELRTAMLGEMQNFTATFFESDRSMLELLTSKETYVNEILAAHYKIDGVVGEDFVPVDLTGTKRQGILTQAGLLSILAHADHTSVVKRGKFLMENILCMSPPPPPADLDIPDLEPPEPGATQREVLEKHREDPICAGCHNLMDPLGFGLEHYDAIGTYRELDNGQPVDASGTIPSGGAFLNGLEMSNLLSQEQDFVACMVRKTFIYSLGRSVTLGDIPYLDEVIIDFELGDHRFADLVVSLATSDVFRMRRGEPD